jgi:2-keto-4-pentenoate hydratase
MNDANIQRAAGMLLAIRQGGPTIAGLGTAAPTTEAETWAIQRDVLQQLGGTIGGYKCAAPPGQPTSAAIVATSGIRRSPATWGVPTGQQIGIETEIAVRFARDLPPRGTPYSLEEVLDAVAAAFPAIELVKSRYTNMRAVTPLESMADNVAHVGFIHGADVPNWRSVDLKSLKVRQMCGDTVQVEKVGGNPSGDPLIPLHWIANHLHQFGLFLKAGQIVTTGSTTGLIFVDGGQRVTSSFEGFGEVSVDLA